MWRRDTDCRTLTEGTRGLCTRAFPFNNCNNGEYPHEGEPDAATAVFVKDARYDKMMEAFGGVGVHATTPDELRRAVDAAMDSGKPTLVNAVIDPAAGSESGNISSLNPQSKLQQKKRTAAETGAQMV